MQDEKSDGRDRQVNNQILYQDKVIEGLANQVDQLWSALSSILSEVPPDVSDKSQVEDNLCVLADSIRSHNQRVQKITDLVVDMLARLEI